MLFTRPAAALAACLSFAFAAVAAPGEVLREFIYEKAPFPECHASTITETTNGLVASWFGGTKEKHPDVAIWVSLRDANRWSEPFEVANGMQSDGRRLPCWNPVLHTTKSGDVLLYYKIGPSPENWWGMLRISHDGGRTWTAPQRFPDEILGPIKNRGVDLDDGTYLAGSSTEAGGWKVHFERTRDDGRTWERSVDVADPDGAGLIQPGLAVLGPGRVAAFCRSKKGFVYRTDTSDGGRTWTEARRTTLPNPNSGIDAINLRDGRILVVYNHTDGNWGRRSPLNVAVSRDGEVWEAAAVLEDEPEMEFSYPAVIQTADGMIHVTYTWKRKKVRHVVLDPAKLQTHPITDWRVVHPKRK